MSEQNWIDQLKHEHNLYKKHLAALESELSEIEKQNANLRSKIGLVLSIAEDNHWHFEESEIEYQVYSILNKALNTEEK